MGSSENPAGDMAESSILISVVVILSVLPGSLGDNYNVGGLVAASIISFFAFVAMIVMLVLVVTWNHWFPRYQNWKGRTKRPRPIKPKFDFPPQQNGVQHIPLSNQNSRPGSRPSTQRGGIVSKPQNGTPAVYSAVNPSDSWIQGTSPTGYEEKAGQINFGEEEEDVIVTEILKTSQIANGRGTNTGPSQSNGIGQTVTADGIGQTVTADEIQLTLERQPMEGDKTTGGIMDFHFPEDEAVVNLSASKRDQNDGEMILY